MMMIQLQQSYQIGTNIKEAYIKVNGNLENEVDMEDFYVKQRLIMRDFGKMIYKMDKEELFIKIRIVMKANGSNGEYNMDKKEGFGEFVWPDGRIK